MLLSRSVHEEGGRWLAFTSLFAVIAIGRSLQIANGILHPDAIWWLTAALVVASAGALVPRPATLARLDTYLIALAAAAGLAANLRQLYTKLPILVVSLPPDALAAFNWRLAALTLVAGSLLWKASDRVLRLQIAALVAVHFAMGVWTIHQSPSPAIDVHIFQRDAITALRHGTNPYSLTYPDIYGDASFYGPGLSLDGRLQFGFPYFPVSLLLALPGQLLGGDHRYAQLAALELSAVLMAFARPRGFGGIAAALFLTTPRVFFVLEQAWTEPFVVLGVASVVFAACRYERAVPWMFGAFLALKQYLVLAIPAAWLLVRRRGDVIPLLVKASLVATAVTIPFILWSPGDFWKSVVALQFHQPFRPDALSYLAWWTQSGHHQPPATIPFVAAGIAAAITLWRIPRTPAGFAAGLALTLFAFFAFNKQAFCNYYFFVIGAYAVSIAACTPPEER